LDKDLKEFLGKASHSTWSDLSELNSFNLSDESIIELLTNKSVYEDFSKKVSINGDAGNVWYVSTILRNQVARLKNITVDIIENSLNDDIVIYFLKAGHFPDISYVNKIAQSRKGDAQVYAAHYCDIDTLEKIRKSKNSKVRAIAYQRLGPVGYLDEMLADKKKDIRIMGLDFAPINYPYLSKMVGEISREAFMVLIRKVNINDIPLFLGNRNMKDSYIKSIVQNRMQ
jgi:hypothetical protein